MRNEKLCNVIAGLGCGIGTWCLGLMFFGMTGAIFGVIAGVTIAAIGLFCYE